MQNIVTNAPLFSIIVPIYGVEKYLRNCLNSILNQTFHDYEVILVDDGSKDDSPKICDEFVSIDFRFKVIHKTNGGLVSARQAGVHLAKGKFIVCIDGDDWIGLNYLKSFAEIVIKYKPDVVVCGRTTFICNNSRKIVSGWQTGFYDRQKIETEIFPSLLQTSKATYFPPSLWAKAFKRSIYQQQQLIDTIVNMGEDTACTIPTIYHSQSLYISDECDYFYRINPSSMTQNRKPFMTDGPRIIYNHLLKQLDIDKFDFQEQLYRKTVRGLFSVVKTQFYKKQSFWKTRREIIALIQEEPYKECLKNCTFSGNFAAIIMVFCLRKHFMLPIYLFSRLK